jgi:hypothetical protein
MEGDTPFAALAASRSLPHLAPVPPTPPPCSPYRQRLKSPKRRWECQCDSHAADSGCRGRIRCHRDVIDCINLARNPTSGDFCVFCSPRSKTGPSLCLPPAPEQVAVPVPSAQYAGDQSIEEHEHNDDAAGLDGRHSGSDDIVDEISAANDGNAPKSPTGITDKECLYAVTEEHVAAHDQELLGLA